MFLQSASVVKVITEARAFPHTCQGNYFMKYDIVYPRSVSLPQLQVAMGKFSQFHRHMGWVIGGSPKFCFLKSWVLLWSQLTAYMACVLVLPNKSVNLLMLSGSLLYLLRASGGQALKFNWGNFTLEGLVPLSASPLWLSTSLESLVCACKRRNVSTTVHAVKRTVRTSRFPVQLNLTYMTQRLLYPVFLVSVTSLHFCMFVCKV